MRRISLCALLLGAVSVLAYAVTLRSFDGAGVDPPGMSGAMTNEAAVPVTDPAARAATSATDRDWWRLQRLARDGDAEAALLLTILDAPAAGIAALPR